jgi:hypothetical protein
VDKIRPLLRRLQRNIDRAAVVVFAALTALVVFIWQAEQASPPTEPPPVPPSRMPDHLPNDEYAALMRSLTWNDTLFEERPLDDEHPLIEIIRQNLFLPREPPTEQEMIERVNQTVREAAAALSTARELPDDDPRKREQLERCIDRCDQIITVWSALSGGAQQGPAEEMRDEAQELLNTILGVGGEETAGD